MQTGSVESVFSRAWELLTHNWIIIVPGLVVGFISGVLQAIFTPQFDPNTVGTLVTAGAAAIGSIVVLAVGIIAQIITQCYTTGMAGAAWARGRTTLGDGAQAFSRDAGHVLMALLYLFLAGIVAAILAPPTLSISVALFVFFTIYTFAAAVVGERPGFVALTESFKIASRRVVPTAIVVVLIIAVSIVASMIGGELRLISPYLGSIIAAMISQSVLAYVTLVIVGEYLALRGAAADVPPPTMSA